MKAVWLMVPLLAVACSKNRTEVRTVEGDTDTDTDSDSDVDTDTDADADGDTDTDEGPGCEEDDLEGDGNEDFNTAVSLGSLPFDGALTEDSTVDYYRFDVDDIDQFVQVDVGFVHARGDINLTVFKPNQGQVTGGTSSSQSDDEQVIFEATEIGPHYIRVRYSPNAGQECIVYDIDVTFDVPDPDGD